MDLQKDTYSLTLDCLPPEILTEIFSFLGARFLQEIVSKVCSKFSTIISDEAYWKRRIQKRWASKYPPVIPTIPLNWGECAMEREEMVKRFEPGAKNFQSITITKTHYSACDAILLLPIPNRHFMVSGSRDRSLVLWDVKGVRRPNDNAWSRVITKKADAHGGWVWSLSSNGTSRFVSCGWDSMIHLWNVSNDAMNHESDINCGNAILTSSYLNDIVTVGTFDRRIQSYDLRSSNSSKHIEQYSHHKKPVLSVHLPKKHENFLITASEDGSVTLIDRRARRILSKLIFTDGFPICMDMMDGDNCLYVGDKCGNLHLIETSHGNLTEVKSVEKLHTKKILGIDASRCGIITCSSDRTVRIVEPDLSMKTIVQIDENFGEVTAVTYSNGILAMGHSEEVIQIYDRSNYGCE